MVKADFLSINAKCIYISKSTVLIKIISFLTESAVYENENRNFKCGFIVYDSKYRFKTISTTMMSF